MKGKRNFIIWLLCLLATAICGVSLTACNSEPNCADGHTYGEWTVTQEATCLEKGAESRICTVCNEAETRELAATGHTFGSWEITTAPTCTEKGAELRVCECGETETREVAAKEHNFGAWETVEQATCTKGGLEKRVCANDSTHVEERPVEKLAHDYSANWKHDTVNHWKECGCGEKTESGKHVWNAGELKTPAGEYTEGVMLYTCTVCTETKEEPIAPLGHTHGPVKTSAKAATCTADGNIEYWYCDGCEKYFSDAECKHTVNVADTVIPATHTLTYTAAKAATCTTNGNIEYWYCSACNKYFSDANATTEITQAQTVVKAGHELTHVAAKDKTCTVNGNIEYWYCSACKKYFSDANATTEITLAQTVVKAGHELTHVAAKDKTCTVNGNIEYWYCSACNKYFSDASATTEILHADTVIKASHSLKKTDAVAATCTEDGNKEYWTCSACNKYYANENATAEIVKADTVIAKAHKPVKTEAVAASCTTQGNIEYYQCSACKKYYADETCVEELNKADTVLPASHTLEKTAAVDATCTTDGNKEYWTCDVCDKLYSDKNGVEETTRQDTVVPAAHKVTRYAQKNATCTENGYQAYYQCLGCEKYFSDETAATEITLQSIVIPAAHTALTTSVQAATCTQAGAKTTTCGGCDYVDVEIIEKTEHAWGEPVITAATCETDGYTLKSCGVCGGTEKTDVVAATGHKTATRVTKAATCVETGVSETYCSVEGCGKIIKTETIEKTEHNYLTTTVEVDCETDGYTQHTCQNPACGYSYKENIVESEGHDWEETRVPASCTEAGYVLNKCSVCEEEDREVLVALGHDWNVEEATCLVSQVCETCGSYGEEAKGHLFTTVKENVPATCEANGHITYECARGCGSTQTEVPDGYTKKGHTVTTDWSEKAKQAVVGEQCTYIDVQSATCSSCQATVYKYSEKYVEHNYKMTITRHASCVAQGEKMFTCQNDGCTHVATENFDADEKADVHKWNEGVLQADGVTTVYTCVHDSTHTKTTIAAKNATNASVDNSALQETGEVELQNATITLDDTAKQTIGEKADEGEKVKLSADMLEGDALKEALDWLGASATGVTEVFNLTLSVGEENVSNFGENAGVTVRIPYTLAAGEDPEEIAICYINGTALDWIKATYIELDTNGDGVVEGYAVFTTNHFSYYTVTATPPAKRCELYGHNYVEVNKPATCLEDGYDSRVCSRCAHRVVDNTYDALGHDWTVDEATKRAATCTADSYEKTYCSRCDIYFETVEKATGHTWKQTENVAASCEATGKHAFECENCDSTYMVILPVLEHAYESVITEPTCTSYGFTTKTCGECGDTVTSAFVAPLSHEMEARVFSATCTAAGYTERYCKLCNVVFEVIAGDAATGHDWTVEEPTCTDDKECRACGVVDGRAHGHDMQSNGHCRHCNEKCCHDYKEHGKVDPTCTHKGYTVYRCAICMHTENRDEKPMKEHAYEKGNVIAPTCKHKGYTEYHCPDCGSSKHDDETDMRHEEYIVENVDSDCERNGHILYGCKHCDEYTRREEKQRGEHKYKLVGATEADCENNGYNIYQCKCGEIKKVVNTNKLGHAYDENGVCETCGKVADRFWLEIIESWQDVESIAMEIENLSISLSGVQLDGKGNSSLISKFSLKQIDIAKLMLGVNEETGELEGAAYGNFVVENGMLGKQNCTFNAIIENGEITLAATLYTQEYYVSATFDELFAQMGIPQETLSAVVGLIETDILPLLKGFVDSNEGEMNKFVNDAMSILFTREKTAEGYVLALDYAKVYALNENLAKMTVKELVNHYFGDGAYDGVYAFAEELLATEMGGLLDYADSLGFDKGLLVKTINDLAKMSGTEGKFDIEELFTSEDLAGMTVAEYLGAMTEQPDFAANILSSISGISEMNVYGDLLYADYVDELKTSIDNVIAEVEKFLAIRVGTDNTGKLTSLALSVDGLAVDVEGDDLRIALDLDIIPNGEVVLTWTDLLLKLTDLKELPVVEGVLTVQMEERTLEQVEKDEQNGQYMEIYRVYVRKYVIPMDSVMAWAVSSDCGDWYNYSLALTNQIECRYVYYYEGFMYEKDGTLLQHAVVDETMQNPSMDGTVPEEWWSSYTTSGASFYYNPVTGEFSNNTAHKFVLDEEKSYQNDCSAESYSHYYCTECGYEQGVYSRKVHNVVEKYVLSEGAESCEDGVDLHRVCTVCNQTVDVIENWTEGHVYQITYQIENGEVMRSSACAVCGETQGATETVGTLTVDEELNATLGAPNHRFGEGCLTLVLQPTQSGVYEFYVKKAVNDFRFYFEGPNGGTGGFGGNFYQVFKLEAGETYYVYTYGYDAYGDLTICRKRDNIEIELNDYGMECGGGTLIIEVRQGVHYTVDFETTECHFEQLEDGTYYCVNCNFGYRCDEIYESKEQCAEMHVLRYVFIEDVTAETPVTHTVEYIDETGNQKHQSDWEHNGESSEYVDEKTGKVYTLYTEYEMRYCRECGLIIFKDEIKRFVDENGNTVRVERARCYGVWAEDGSCVLLPEYKETNENVYVTVNGKKISLTTFERTEQYDRNGELSYWSQYEYFYEDGDYCHAQRRYTSSSGKERTEEYVSHRSTVVNYALSVGSTLCTDGLDRIESCGLCGEVINTYQKYEKEHILNQTAKETVNISAFASCGDHTLGLYVCPCGSEAEYRVGETKNSSWMTGEDGNEWCVCYDCGFAWRTEEGSTTDEDCNATGYYTVYVTNLNIDNAYENCVEYTVEFNRNEKLHDINGRELDRAQAEENGLTMETVTTEFCCEKCGLITGKSVVTTKTDADGDELYVRDEQYLWTENGYGDAVYVREKSYGAYIAVDGKKVLYPIYQYEEQLQENGEKTWTRRTYTYTDGYCVGNIIYEDKKGVYGGESFNYHRRTETRYELNENSSVCEDGVDHVEVCLDCGKELNRWGGHYGHVTETTYERVGNDIFRNSVCKVCGENLIEDENAEAFTLTLGANESVELISDDKLEKTHLQLQFVPSQTATYEFWSENYTGDPNIKVYDANYNQLYYEDDYSDLNFYLTCELIAGETYYIVIGREGITCDIYLNVLPKPQEVALGAFGSSCGGTMTVETVRGEKRFTNFAPNCLSTYEKYVEDYGWFSCCTKCGFGWAYADFTRPNENCQEIRYTGYYFLENVSADEWTITNYLFEKKTGNIYHTENTRLIEDLSGETTETDDNGNVITIRTQTRERFCEVCGKIFERSVNVVKCTADGMMELYNEYAYYTPLKQDDGTYTYWLHTKRVYAYGTCALDNGVTRHYTIYTLSENYDENGNVTWFERNDYRYTDAYFCEGVRTYSGTNYQTREYIFVSHNEAHYRENNEETTGMDADGNETQIFVRTEECYCAVCGKVTARNVYTDVINETKQTHEYHSERWCIETKTGSTELVCIRLKQTVYGVTEVNGEAFEYRLSDYTKWLNSDGEARWSKLEYTYADGSYCQGTVHVTGSDGEDYTEPFEHHENTKSVYSLSDGSVTCEDGLDKKVVCVICSAVLEESTKAYYSHEYNMESTKIGSCGSELLSYSCPCGERAEYDFYRACENFKLEDGIEICLDCGYGFRKDFGHKTDDNCQQIYYTTVTVYPSEGEATTYHAEWYTGEKSHAYAWKELLDESGREEITDENGTVIGTVETYAQEYYCKRCFASFRKNVSVKTYDENGTQVAYEYRQYVSFANDADDYGYRLSTKNEVTYGAYEVNGKIYTYTLSEITYHYDESEACTEWDRYDYVYEGEDYCHATRIYTNQNNERSEDEYQNHSHKAYTYALSNGSDSCAEGIDRIEFCLMCGETTSTDYHYDSTNYHNYYVYEPVEVIDLSAYGAVCGGTAKVYACPCGVGKKVVLDLNGMLEQSGGYKGHNEATGEFDIYEYTYVCAVTAPETCGFTYMHRTWWTRSTTCEQIHQEQYVFGVGNNTYTVAWSYNTHSINHYIESENETHTTETDGDYTVNVTKWDYVCKYCRYHNYTYTHKSYRNANGSEAWYSEQYDYYGQSNVTHTNYYAYKNVSTSFNGNEYSLSVRLAAEHTYFDENGNVTSWEKYAFAYPESYCTEEVTYTNSRDEENRYTNEHSYYSYWTYYANSGWTKACSCTQYGVSTNTCVWCLDVDEETHSPYGHSYNSYDDGRYVCYHCGLENFTGADGVVELEDLTSHEYYSDGENYVVGYQVKDETFVYTLVLELIADGLEEPITLYNAALGEWNEFTVSDDGVSFVRFSMSAVQELAATNGVGTCEYMVRVNFIPTDASTFDYAITLDPHYFETTMQAANACGAYAKWKTCAFCGKVKELVRYGSCNWSASFSVEEIDEISYDVTTYTCEDCGLIFVQKVALVNCVQYWIDCWDQNGDGTFEVVHKTQTIEHSYSNMWAEGATIYSGCQCGGIMNSVTVQSQTEMVTPVAEKSWETQKYFTFTATQSGEYSFYSTRADKNGGDPYGYLYDSDEALLVSDDDSNDNLNFTFTVELTAGKTYILMIERNCNCTVTIEYLGA